LVTRMVMEKSALRADRGVGGMLESLVRFYFRLKLSSAVVPCPVRSPRGVGR
jgi:hypothetical protein